MRYDEKLNDTLDGNRYEREYGKFQREYLRKYHSGLISDGLLDAMAKAMVRAAAFQLVSEMTRKQWMAAYDDAEHGRA